MRRTLALLLFLGLTLSAAAPAMGARKVPVGFIGVQANGPLLDSPSLTAPEFTLMARAGVETVRADLWWRIVEFGGPDRLDWSSFDTVVYQSARNHISVLPIVELAPPWASAEENAPFQQPRDPADLGRFVAKAIARYGPGGSFWAAHPELRVRPVRRWQIWNEPNLLGGDGRGYYWRPQPFAPAFVNMLRVVHQAMKTADRGSSLVLAALTNDSWNQLRKVYQAGGRGTFDEAAINAYTARPPDLIRLARLVRGVMQRYGDKRKPLTLTEISWPAALGKLRSPVYFNETDQRVQARNLRAAYLLLSRYWRSLRINYAFWYTWLTRDTPVDRDPYDYAGLRYVRGLRVFGKPAYNTFRSTALGLEGCRRKVVASRCA